MKVGFIGLGSMGLPMAANLIKAGHEVIVWNRTRSRAEGLKGATVADQAAHAAAAPVVITMLSDDRALEDVMFGSGGVMKSMAQGATHISASTISVALSQRLAEAHRAAGHAYVAAPVFGRPQAAEAAQLFIVAAGPQDAIDKARPLFDAMGQRTFVAGAEAPAANVVKLSGNFLIASIIESLGEAFALIRKSGVDPQTYFDILTSSLFNAPVFKTYGGLVAHQQFRPAGFKFELGLKDIRLALAAAEAQSVPMPVASLIRDRFLSGMATGWRDADWSAIAQLAAAQAGL